MLMNLKPAENIRPTIWKSVAPYNANHDFKLPKLPVPSLDQTAQLLSKSVKALSNDTNKIAALEHKLASFVANEGPNLQSRLHARRMDPEHVNWLEQYWDDAAYMAYRDSVVVNVSFFYGFVPTSRPLSETQYAARIAHYALQFRKMLFDGQLDPDVIGKDRSPLCMNSYRFMFDACRIPCKPADYVSVNRQKIGHIAVTHKGNWWSVPATTADGIPLSVSELEQKINYIINQSVKEGFIGLLTTRNRDKWADDRIRLIQNDPQNGDSLAEIESAAFVIALDGTQTLDSPVAKSRHLWHAGDGGKFSNNRFVDKPAQFICWTDKRSNTARGGLMGEHSAMDGTPLVRLCEYVVENIEKTSPASNELLDQDTINAERKDTPAPKRLPFNENGLERSTAEAWNEIKNLTNSQVLGYTLTSYGKGAIKKAGFSPDAWTQMIIQLAYSRLVASEGVENIPVATYEAAMTRLFANGRTECVRSATSESALFTNAMNDSAKTNEERKSALQDAVKIHIENMKQAGLGQGCDRHLFGLKKTLLPNEQVPDLFSDELFNVSTTWTLSTSQISSMSFDTYGWGEVAPNGFGIAYAIFEDYLQFTVTNTILYGTAEEKNEKGKKRNIKFVSFLNEAANDMLMLFRSSQHLSKL